MLVVQQADCEKIMHEVWVFRGQRGPLPVYVPKLFTGPQIGTTTNVVLINSFTYLKLLEVGSLFTEVGLVF